MKTLREEFAEIEEEMKTRPTFLYQVKCPACGSTRIGIEVSGHIHSSRGEYDDNIVESYICNDCGNEW